MAVSGIKLKGWDTFANLLQPGKFQKRLEKEVGRAVARSGKVAEAAIRRQIKGGRFPKNADLTQAVKGSSKPLVDRSDLFQAVTSKQAKWNEVFAGVLRTAAAYNVALTVHNGKDIPVTQRMRNLFFILWLASMGRPLAGGGTGGRAAELFARHQNWKPLSPNTKVIRIPSRPFVERAMDDHRLRQSVEQGWPRAIQRALKPG